MELVKYQDLRARRKELVQVAGFTGVDAKILEASAEKMIAEYEPKELAVNMRALLKYISRDVGYRMQPDDEQYVVTRTTSLLGNYYKFMTLHEIKLAFEMLVVGELDEYLPKDRNGQPDKNHYQQFNAEYLCKVLNAYKSRRSRAMKKASDAVPERPELPVSPDEAKRYRNINKASTIRAFLYYKYHGRLIKANAIEERLMYGVLAEVGLADAIDVPDNEQQMLIREQLKELTQRGRKDEAERLRHNTDEMRFQAFLRCRRKAIKAAFDWLLDEDLQLINYISYEREN